MSNAYTFKKGDTGLTRGGDKFEVVAEYRFGTEGKTRIAVVLTTTSGTQQLLTVRPHGKWQDSGLGEHHHDLIVPTEKRWIVRTESTLRDRNSYRAISYEYDNEANAKHEYNEFLRFTTSFKNTTITEVEVPLTRR